MTTIAADETRLEGQATQPSDATESTSDNAELAELSRWLEGEETQGEEEQKPATGETESEATDEATEDPELEAAVNARAERIAEERAEQARQEERTRLENERNAEIAATRWRGVEESFRQRAPRIRSHLEAVAAGDAELNVDGILNEFNQHHAQMLGVRDAEWHNALFDATASLLPEADKQRLAALRQRGELPVAKLLEERDKAITAKAKEGLHPESRLKEEHARGALSYRNRLEKMLKDDPTGESVLAVLRARTSPAASRTTTTPAATRTSTNILTDPNTPISAIEAELAKVGL